MPAARPVFSVNIARGGIDVFSSPLTLFPLPGFKWVVRDITLLLHTSDVGPYALYFGIEVTDSSGNPIHGTGNGCGHPGQDFHWTGRQVIEQEDGLMIATEDYPGWSFRVSGYQLSLP